MSRLISRKAALLTALAALLAGCQGTPSLREPSRLIGTFAMGERVQVGPLIYTVLEGTYKSQLADDPAATPPKNRYLVVKMTITNTGKDDTSIPHMTLTGANGQSISELTEIKEDVPGWFGGVLRRLKAAQTETGVVVFDVPLSAYKLKVTDGGDIENEKYALIDIPVQIQ